MKFESKEKKVPYAIRIRKDLLEKVRRLSKKYSTKGNYVSCNEIIEKAVEELIKKV